MSNLELEVTEVEHYTDTLFRVKTTRPESFRFRSGEFAMISLPDGKTPMRAYSIASPNYRDELEFYSIAVPDGPLTSKLVQVDVGDKLVMSPKPVGTLVTDALTRATNLWLFCTGTGVAPFASLARAPETYDRFENVILVHTCRYEAELTYSKALVEDVNVMLQFFGIDPTRFRNFITSTRDGEEGPRVTKWLKLGIGHQPYQKLTRLRDRVMICGSMDMTKECQTICREELNMTEGSVSRPADFVIEKAFVS